MTAMAGQQEEVKISLCIHAYKYASVIKYIKINEWRSKTYALEKDEICGEALKWSELKLEVMIDQENCLPKSLKADLISENLTKCQIDSSHVRVLLHR